MNGIYDYRTRRFYIMRQWRSLEVQTHRNKTQRIILMAEIFAYLGVGTLAIIGITVAMIGLFWFMGVSF